MSRKKIDRCQGREETDVKKTDRCHGKEVDVKEENRSRERKSSMSQTDKFDVRTGNATSGFRKLSETYTLADTT